MSKYKVGDKLRRRYNGGTVYTVLSVYESNANGNTYYFLDDSSDNVPFCEGYMDDYELDTIKVGDTVKTQFFKDQVYTVVAIYTECERPAVWIFNSAASKNPHTLYLDEVERV